MSKSVIVFEAAPNCCGDCPFNREVGRPNGERRVCIASYLDQTIEDLYSKLPCCPFKELPEFMDEGAAGYAYGATGAMYAKGHNNCLKKIIE